MTGRKRPEDAAVVSPWLHGCPRLLIGSSQPSASWSHEALSSLHSVAHVPATAARAPAVPQKPSCGTSLSTSHTRARNEPEVLSHSQFSQPALSPRPTARRVALRLRSARQATCKRLGPASRVETYKWNVTRFADGQIFGRTSRRCDRGRPKIRTDALAARHMASHASPGCTMRVLGSPRDSRMRGGSACTRARTSPCHPRGCMCARRCLHHTDRSTRSGCDPD